MHKSSASFIANLGAAAARKHAGDDDVTPPEPVSGLAGRIGHIGTNVIPGSVDMSGRALGYPAVAGGLMGAGAGAGGVAGGVAGALHGLLSPGEDEEGEERSRLIEALKRALQYGAVGTVAGAAAGPALLPGGLIGGLGAHALTGDYVDSDASVEDAIKGAADLGRAAARQMHKQAAPPTGGIGKAIAASEGLRTLLPPAKPLAKSMSQFGSNVAGAAEVASPNMINPTPTGDLPNYYDQEMYELNRPGNQADSPSYRSGSALKPEIQAAFPPEWFRGRPKNTPPSYRPLSSYGDDIPSLAPVPPEVDSEGNRMDQNPIENHPLRAPSFGNQARDRTGRLIDEPTLQGGSWDDPRGTGR